MTSNNNLGAISTCPSGEEKYVHFNLMPRRKSRYLQYEWRDPSDGTLFSCVGSTLEKCREKRDQWLEKRAHL